MTDSTSWVNRKKKTVVAFKSFGCKNPPLPKLSVWKDLLLSPHATRRSTQTHGILLYTGHSELLVYVVLNETNPLMVLGCLRNVQLLWKFGNVSPPFLYFTGPLTYLV